jgi:hypothetical protein
MKRTRLARVLDRDGFDCTYVMDANDDRIVETRTSPKDYVAIAEGGFVPKSRARDRAGRSYRLWCAANGMLFRVYSDRSTKLDSVASAEAWG